MKKTVATSALAGALLAGGVVLPSAALAQVYGTPAVPSQDAVQAGSAEPGSGKDLYLKRCAGCHGAVADPEADARSGPSRIPTRAALEKRQAFEIVEALTYGAMTDMAIGLSDADVAKIAAFLTAKPAL